ncbi:hypothetical protein QQ020_18740 [Fulvivirgaceae bacterium BMA12]|uniref:Uncharacterized protein n=1 Tax=Agaribacillus aureus TaxID=3051825 RepID=A0ABT8LAM1_9BACT|nr:hypothetical protein [Fulvivirgaceae bacterium BMA12]
MKILWYRCGEQKNIKAAVILVITIFFSPLVYAQNHPPGFYQVFDNSAGLVMEIPLAVKDDLGDLFINDTWRLGAIELFNELVIDEYYYKYEIVKDHFELQTSEGIKILPGSWVKKFNWKEPELNRERQFVTGKGFFVDKVPFDGFFEVLFKGKVSLLLKVEAEVMESNYVPQFNIGTQGKQYQKKELYYMAEPGNTFLLNKKIKQNLPHFGEDASNIEDYVKTNKLKFNRPNDLIRIVEYYDKLKSSSN